MPHVQAGSLFQEVWLTGWAAIALGCFVSLLIYGLVAKKVDDVVVEGLVYGSIGGAFWFVIVPAALFAVLFCAARSAVQSARSRRRVARSRRRVETIDRWSPEEVRRVEDELEMMAMPDLTGGDDG